MSKLDTSGHPGRDAARSAASQIRDRERGEPRPACGSGSALHHFMLQRARNDTKREEQA